VRDLEYSADALNAKNAFYRAKTMIYVEGDDDVIFWEEVFSHIPDFAFEIESVGGSPELDKHIKNIEAGSLDAIAARDADFLRLTNRLPTSPRVVYTHGYAIENSLYTADVLHYMARSWCKSPSVTQAHCAHWLHDLASSFAPLIALDIANAVSNSGVAVLPDNCTRFMTGQTTGKVCPKKIARHATETMPRLPKKAVAAGNTVVAASATAPLEYLRGHLLASAVLKFLLQTATTMGKKINISMDALYAAAIANFSRSLTGTHPHKAYYSAATSAAAACVG
jgi:hypothetical protein